MAEGDQTVPECKYVIMQTQAFRHTDYFQCNKSSSSLHLCKIERTEGASCQESLDTIPADDLFRCKVRSITFQCLHLLMHRFSDKGFHSLFTVTNLRNHGVRCVIYP